MRDAEIIDRLEQRLGVIHARQRLGIEAEHEARVFNGGFSLFHLENWYSVHGWIRGGMRLLGLHGRGVRNALDIRCVTHEVSCPRLPPALDGFRILQLSDLHIDIGPQFQHALLEAVRRVEYDLVVLTGDYRFRTFGDIEPALRGLEALRAQLRGEVYAVLGNHDSIRMVPAMEQMGIRLLLNESSAVGRGPERFHLVGIDDAHFFGVDSLEKALNGVPLDAMTVLLSHTPEVYRQAAHAAVDLMLSGHTHGGQICLPGGYPITLDARLPRSFGRGAWRYGQMTGYTSPGAGSSIVGLRLNCPPEITVHRLRTQ